MLILVTLIGKVILFSISSASLLSAVQICAGIYSIANYYPSVFHNLSIICMWFYLVC